MHHTIGSIQLHSPTPPQSTAAWLGVSGIGQGMEKLLHLLSAFFRILQAGDFKANINYNQVEKFNCSARSAFSQTPQSTSAWRGVGSDGKRNLVQPVFKGKN
jgi:hypothetical protein